MTERVDAMRAAEIAEYRTSDGLRTALGCTLVKAGGHLAVFDEVFDLYFQPSVAGQAARDEHDGHAADATADEAPDLANGEQAPEARLNLDHAVRAILSHGSDALARQVAEQGVAEFARFQPGLPAGGVMYERWTLEALRLDELAQDRLTAIDAAAADSAVPWPRLRLELQRAEVKDRAELLRGHVRRVIRELLVADRGSDAVAKTLRRPLAADIDISMASREELREVQRAMLSVQRKLATTMMRKQRNRTDLIDVRATLRASMGTGGVPLRVVHRKPRPTKPRLYILADMSNSVATFATFTITLVSAMSQMFSQLRSFAFIQNVAEVSDVFQNIRDPAQARAAIRDFVAANELGTYTDYGRALRQFYGAAGHQLERRSTVLVFGDARGNYLPSEETTLSEIAGRAGSVYWLNPEPEWLWNTGDSMMHEYGPHCTAAVTCRTLNDLRQFIERIG